MKSNSAGAGLRRGCRAAARASEAWLLCDQLGDDGRIGLDRLGGRRRHGAAGAAPEPSAGAGTKSPRSSTVSSASRSQRIALAEQLEQGCAARRRGQASGDVDEQPAAGVAHRPRRGQLPDGEPERLHRVGHHLLVTDRDVDVVARRRRPRGIGNSVVIGRLCTTWKLAVREAPLDVLRAAEVRLDPPAELREPHHLRVGQRRLRLPLGVDRLLSRPAAGHGVDGELLAPTSCRRPRRRAPCRRRRSRGRRPAPRRARSPPRPTATLRLPVMGSAVNRTPGRLREDHPLDHHGHVDRAVVDAVAQAVGHRPLGEQRGPAAPDVLEDRGRPDDVQVRVLLARERGRRQVLGRRAGAHGVGGVVAERASAPVIAAATSSGIAIRLDRLGGPPRWACGSRRRSSGSSREPVQPAGERRRVRHHPAEGVRRDAEAGRHADAVDRESSPRCGPCHRPARSASGRCPRDPPRSASPAHTPSASHAGIMVPATPRRPNLSGVRGGVRHRAAGVFPRQVWPAAPECPTADSRGSQPPKKPPADSATAMIGCNARGRIAGRAARSLRFARSSHPFGGALPHKMRVLGVGLGVLAPEALGLLLAVPIQVLS